MKNILPILIALLALAVAPSHADTIALLPSASSLGDTDLVMVQQASNTTTYVKGTALQFKTYVLAGAGVTINGHALAAGGSLTLTAADLSLATVATTGSYTSLINTPTIPPAITLTTTGSGAATFNAGTGALNIPTPTGAAWGNITGTLSSQTDLVTALGLKANTSSLAAVATSGSYTSLINTPTIPPAITLTTTGSGAATFNTGTGALNIPTPTGVAWGNITGTLASQTDLQSALNLKANTSSLSTVATSGSYTDLANKPTIPTVASTSSLLKGNGSSGAVAAASSDVQIAIGSGVYDASGAAATAQAAAISSAAASAASIYVPQTTTVNGHALSGNVAVTAADIGAPTLSGNNTLSGTNNFTGTFQVGGSTFSLGGTTSITGGSLAVTLTGATAVTFPTSGVLATTGSNTFSASQTAPGVYFIGGPTNFNIKWLGDSRFLGYSPLDPNSYYSHIPGYSGYETSPCAQLQSRGFGANATGINISMSGQGIQTGLYYYYGIGSTTTTGNVTASSNTVSSLASTTGLTSSMTVGGPGLYPGTLGTYTSGTSLTLSDGYGRARTPSTTTTGATLNFASPVPYGTYQNLMPGVNTGGAPLNTGHQLSTNISGVSGMDILDYGINDVQTITQSMSCTNGQTTMTYSVISTLPLPVVGYSLAEGTDFPGGTVVSAVSVSGTTITVTASNAFTGSTGTRSVTVTPVIAAWETQCQALINDCKADGDYVEICTIPKAYLSTWLAGDSFRVAWNAWIISTYGTETNALVSGVKVCDLASMSIFGSNNTLIYSDSLHFTPLGYALMANHLNDTLIAQYPSLVGISLPVVGNQLITQDMLAPMQCPTFYSNIDKNGGNTCAIFNAGTTSFAQVYFNSNGGSGRMAYGLNGGFDFGSGLATLMVPKSVGSTIPVVTNTATAGTVTGSGSITFNEALDVQGVKMVIAQLTALNGTSTFTFPTAFSIKPVEVDGLGLATSISSTATTITGTGQTATVVLIGN